MPNREVSCYREKTPENDDIHEAPEGCHRKALEKWYMP